MCYKPAFSSILGMLILVLLSGYSLSLIASPADNTDQEISIENNILGLAVYKKSNCVFCHGWAGDGQGHPRSPGAAANLRTSVLDKEAMTYIIRCGVVAGVMPYHDRMAYRDARCIKDLSSLKLEMRPQKGKNINEDDLNALVSYLMANIQGRGKVTLDQCEIFYKPGSRNCLHLQLETTD